MPETEVSVIIPTMKGREEMLARLVATIPKKYQIIIISADDLLLAGKRNLGASTAVGKYLLFIDDDNYLSQGAIRQMVSRMKHSIGVMGMVACYSDSKMRVADGGSLRSYLTGFTRGLNTNKKVRNIHSDNGLYEVDEVANAFMIRRRLFEALKGLDEENFPIDLDEADICKRIKNHGHRVVMNAYAICYHNSQTYSCIPDFRRPMNAYFMARNRILFQKLHLSKPKLFLYFLLFFPLFYFSYVACLLYRRKPNMVYHFTKGVIDGISGNKQNPYQKRKLH